MRAHAAQARAARGSFTPFLVCGIRHKALSYSVGERAPFNTQQAQRAYSTRLVDAAQQMTIVQPKPIMMAFSATRRHRL